MTPSAFVRISGMVSLAIGHLAVCWTVRCEGVNDGWMIDQWAAGKMNEQWVAIWVVVVFVAVWIDDWLSVGACAMCPYELVLENMEKGANSVYFCCAGMLQLFDLRVCSLKGLCYFESLLRCQIGLRLQSVLHSLILNSSNETEQ